MVWKMISVPDDPPAVAPVVVADSSSVATAAPASAQRNPPQVAPAVVHATASSSVTTTTDPVAPATSGAYVDTSGTSAALLGAEPKSKVMPVSCLHVGAVNLWKLQLQGCCVIMHCGRSH